MTRTLFRLSLALTIVFSALAGVSAAPAPQEVVFPKPGANVLQPLSKVPKWRLQALGTAKAALTRSGETATIKISASDGTDFHVQLAYLGSVLQEGKTYVLGFKAKANPPRKMAVDGIANQGDYHNIGLFNAVDVGADFQTYTYKFVATGAGKIPLLCPQFLLGESAGSVTLSNVSLVLGTAAPPPPPMPFWFLQRFDPAQALLTTDGTAQVITISKTDGESWHVQLGRLNASVTDGVPLVVKFRAKADTPRDMMLMGGISDGDYHPICDQQYVALNTSWRDYAFRIIPHGSAGHPVGFPQFLLGKQIGTVWIDAVAVKPEASDPVADPAVYAPKAGELRAEGIIQTAGFGPDGFTLLVSRLVRPNGHAVSLSPTRPKPVNLTADTAFRSLSDGSQLYLATLKPGDAVSIIGPDLGVGKSLPARLMLR